MPTSAFRLVVAYVIVLAGAASTTACLRPRVPLPVPPATATPTPTIPGATMQANGFTFTFDVAPAKVGTNIVHMYARTPDRKDASIKAWHVTATRSAGGSQPISVPTVPLSPGHALAQIELPAAGLWRLTFTLRVSDTDEEQLYADVRIS